MNKSNGRKEKRKQKLEQKMKYLHPLKNKTKFVNAEDSFPIGITESLTYLTRWQGLAHNTEKPL